VLQQKKGMDSSRHIPSQISFIANIAQLSRCPNYYLPR
jgi:hypothetical protein